MNIQQLQITVRPVPNEFGRFGELSVSVIANGRQFTVMQPFIDDDFESRFDEMLRNAKGKTLEMIEQHRKRA